VSRRVIRALDNLSEVARVAKMMGRARSELAVVTSSSFICGAAASHQEKRGNKREIGRER
jgi:hypothetical protein